MDKENNSEVSDGDTLKLSSGQTFRLYGVNAPEVKEPLFEEVKVKGLGVWKK